MSKILFCPKCENNFSNFKMDMTESGEPILFYTCSSCLYSEGIPPDDLPNHALLYSKTNLNRKPDRLIHADMCSDPSLPRTSVIPCPNEACPSHKDKDYVVAFLEYNEEKKIAYICCHPECSSMWRKE